MPCPRTLQLSFFKHRSFRTKTEKLLWWNIALLPCCSRTDARNGACEAVWQVSSRSQNPAMVVYSLGSLTLWVSRVEGFQRSLARFHGFNGLSSRRSQQISKVLGRQGFPCEVHGFKGIICQSLQKLQRLQGVRCQRLIGSRVDYEVMNINSLKV